MTPCSNCVDGTAYWSSEKEAKLPNTSAMKANTATPTPKMLRLLIVTAALLALTLGHATTAANATKMRAAGLQEDRQGTQNGMARR